MYKDQMELEESQTQLSLKKIILDRSSNNIHGLGDLLKDMDFAYNHDSYRSKAERKYS